MAQLEKAPGGRVFFEGRATAIRTAANTLFWQRFKKKIDEKLDALEALPESQEKQERYDRAFSAMFRLNTVMMREHLVARTQNRRSFEWRKRAFERMKRIENKLEKLDV